MSRLFQGISLGDFRENQRRFRVILVYHKQQSAGQFTAKVVDSFLSAGREPEQGYKSCASLTRLGDKYGIERLEKACERVLLFCAQPSIRNISTILKNGQDKVQTATGTVAIASPKSHGITRVASYFRKGGEL